MSLFEGITRTGLECAGYTTVGRRRGGKRRCRVELMPAHQDVADLLGRQTAEPQLGTPGTNRRQQEMRPTRDEQEYRGRRGFLERLEQCVLRLRHQPIGIVDDDDAPPTLERPKRHLVDSGPHRVDLDRPGLAWLDDDDVYVHAPGYSLTGTALSTRIGRRRGAASGRGHRGAIEELGHRHGDPTLTDAVRTGKHETGRQRVASCGPRD